MARSCTPEDIERYRDLLLDVGVPIELPSEQAWKDLCKRLTDPKRYPNAAMRNLVAHGFFHIADQGRYFLVLPPEKEILAEVRAAIEADKDHGKVAKIVTKAAEAAGIDLPEAPCVRSPCSDPKTTDEEIEAARALVGAPKLKRRLWVEWKPTGEYFEDGTPKLKGEVHYDRASVYNRPGGSRWPLTVACGLGVDSVAILVGLVQLYRETRDKKWIPEAITFADTGGEHRETYAYLSTLNSYLKKHGFPKVTTVAWATDWESPNTKWGSNRTLEQKCLVNQTLPSIAFGGGECSLTWKQQPQHVWLRKYSGLFPLAENTKIVRAIGYDVEEEARVTGFTGTYRVRLEADAEKKARRDSGDDDEKEPDYDYFYPLMEWGWSRARCIAEIEAEIGKTPVKSACSYCPATKKYEIAALAEKDPELFERALLMEQVYVLGRAEKGSTKGLGRGWTWMDFALGNLRSREDHGILITEKKAEEIRRKAQAWIDSFPVEPKTVDMGTSAAARKLAAFSRPHDLRAIGKITWDKADEIAP